MSARVPSRRSSRRRASEGDSSRQGGIVVAVDESMMDLGASRRGIGRRQGAPAQALVVPPAAPIDVEAIEDDVRLLSPSGMFPQLRRNRPVTIILDEDSDAHVESSGISNEPEIEVTVHNNRQRHRSKQSLINCEIYKNYDNVECSRRSKRKCRMDNLEPQEAALKKPAFTCAICLGHMTEETSTVCGHIFCHGCIKTAIQTQRKCPTCRRSLTIKNIHRVYLPSGP